MRVSPSLLDRTLRPVHRWVWADRGRRARKLLRFAETERSGGRDIARAAERTADPILRRLFLRHAQDEERHAELFRARGWLLRQDGRRSGFEANWLTPGERGLDDMGDPMSDAALLAFLHLSEKAAAGRFALYRQVLGADRETSALFTDVLADEEFHMTYTRTQLARVANVRQGRALWRARGVRIWKAYLRLAAAVAGLLGRVLLTLQYFLIVPIFALLARRAARQERTGWHTPEVRAQSGLEGQY
jgi:bacterioferritin (cytochrome b1)